MRFAIPAFDFDRETLTLADMSHPIAAPAARRSKARRTHRPENNPAVRINPASESRFHSFAQPRPSPDSHRPACHLNRQLHSHRTPQPGLGPKTMVGENSADHVERVKTVPRSAR